MIFFLPLLLPLVAMSRSVTLGLQKTQAQSVARGGHGDLDAPNCASSNIFPMEIHALPRL